MRSAYLANTNASGRLEKPTAGHVHTAMVEVLANEVGSLRKEIVPSTHGTSGPTRFALFGPFACRSLLEVALTAILGRLDPFRVLVVREMQMRPDYAPEKRSLVSIQWSGDIHAEKKVDDLWKIDRNIKDMTRALLGDYYEHLFWRRPSRNCWTVFPPTAEATGCATPSWRGANRRRGSVSWPRSSSGPALSPHPPARGTATD